MKSGRLLPGVDMPVSELVLGTAWYSLERKNELFMLMDDFVAAGGTALDTARSYGESENLIGKWIESRGNRHDIVIVTKGGLSSSNGTRLAIKRLRRKVAKDITESLELLRTDYIDLYLLHRDSPAIPVAQIVDCLNAELERGRIHAFGGSNLEPQRVDEANEYAKEHGLAGFSAVSNNLSLAVPRAPFYPGLISTNVRAELWHARTRIPLLAWSPQARGFFTGRYLPDKHRKECQIQDGFEMNMIRVYCSNDNLERLSRAKELGERRGGRSATQIALAWLLQRPFTVLPIIGPRNREELGSCVDALTIGLSEDECRWLNLER